MICVTFMMETIEVKTVCDFLQALHWTAFHTVDTYVHSPHS